MQTRTAQILVSLLFLTTAISSCDKKEVSPWNQMIEVNNQIVPPVFPERSFVITDYHDVKDTLYTNAINRAITICSGAGRWESYYSRWRVSHSPHPFEIQCKPSFI